MNENSEDLYFWDRIYFELFNRESANYDLEKASARAKQAADAALKARREAGRA